MPANTATAIARPNAPPSWRIMLNVPEALPISFCATALTTTFCAAMIAIRHEISLVESGTGRCAGECTMAALARKIQLKVNRR